MAFTLREATPDDIPGMLDVWFRAFSRPEMLSTFPNSAPTRAWVAAGIERGIRDPAENTVHMIITDDDQDGKVVALSRWIIQPAGSPVPVWNQRWPAEVAEDMSEQVISEMFFQPMERQHLKATEDRAHYFLEVLATHDEYRKRGLGSRLLTWGSTQADQKGVECYLDSASLAKSLYEKHGYVEQPYRDEKCVSIPMLRPVGKLLEKLAGSENVTEVGFSSKTVEMSL